MRIPTFMHVQYVDPDTGYLTEDMQMYHDELNENMRRHLSDDGWQLPRLTASEITNIAPEQPNGTMWYDTTNDQVKIKVGGTVQVVTFV